MTRPDARRIIKSLSGTVHELWTGVCLGLRPSDLRIHLGRAFFLASPSRSRTPRSTPTSKTGKVVRDVAGAYAIWYCANPADRGRRETRSNVIGLPMESLEKALGWVGMAENLL